MYKYNSLQNVSDLILTRTLFHNPISNYFLNFFLLLYNTISLDMIEDTEELLS